MGRTAVKLTSLFGNAVRPEAAPNAGASQTRKIDNYELEQCLGTGGMGTVYRPTTRSWTASSPSR